LEPWLHFTLQATSVESETLPCVDVGLQRLYFFLHQPHRIAAEQKMRRRIGRQGIAGEHANRDKLSIS
jgi:hypothetical protein